MTAEKSLSSTKTIADILNLTQRRVQMLVKDGVLPRVSLGKFDLTPTVQSYVKYLQGRAAGHSTETEQYNISRTRIAAAKATKAEIEAEKLQGEVLPKQDVVLALQKYTTTIASQMDAQAGRIADLVAGEKNPGTCRQIILTENRRIRASAADKLQGAGGIQASSRTITAATGKVRRPVGGSKQNTANRKRRTRAVQK